MAMARGLLSWYIGTCATLVLIVQGLSTLHAITLGVLVVAVSGVAILALVALRPRPPKALSRLRAIPPLRELLPAAIPFALVLPAIVVISFALGWHVPANNWDSMTYHLSRAAYWRQWHVLAHFPTNNLRQDVFPGNAEILLLVTLLLAHTSAFAFMVQFTAYLAATIAVFALGRRLGLRPAFAFVGAGAFATMPEVILQSTSTQNDLTVAAFLICAVYFFADTIHSFRPVSLIMMGAALGLAIGTKPTALLVLPGLCLGAVVILWGARRQWRLTRRLLASVSASLMLCRLLAAPWYIANEAEYGNMSGPPPIIQIQEATHPTAGSLSTHLLRYLISLSDPGWSSALNPSLALVLCNGTTAIHQQVIAMTRLPAVEPAIDSPGIGYNPAPACTYNEDLSWFGISGWLALMLAIGWSIIGLAVRRRDLSWTLAAGAVSFLLCASFLLRWNPWEGRLFIMAMALSSPLLGLVAERISRRVSGRLLLKLVVLYAAVIGLGAAIDNSAKPLSAWSANRATMQVVTRPDMGPIIERIDRSVPTSGRLAIFLNGDDWDYPLFGPHLDRTIEPLVLSPGARESGADGAGDILTHQPGAEVARLFHQRRIEGCKQEWNMHTSESSVPWRLFTCTSHRAESA